MPYGGPDQPGTWFWPPLTTAKPAAPASSPSFVRSPEGNGCAERFIRTFKEQLLWVRTFSTVEVLRRALLDWAHRYNEQWLLERHNFLSPSQVRRELMQSKQAA